MGLRRAPEFEAWLQRMRITDGEGRLQPPSSNRLLAGMKDLKALAA
jgi:ethanolamine ammonia-lyase large subunit